MPVIPDSLNELLKEVCAEWDDAEKAIKRAELLVGDAVIPAIIEVFSDYTELLAARDDVHDQVSKARENRENRDEIYDSMRRVEFTRLETVYKKFRSCEPIMRRRTIKTRIGSFLGWLFAIITLSTAVLGTMFGYVQFINPSTPPEVSSQSK